MADDLGMKRKDLWGGCNPCGDSKDYENEIVYPSLSLEGKQVDAGGLGKLQFGDEVTITVTARVSRIGGQSSPDELPGLTLDVMTIDAGKKSTGKGLAGAYRNAVDES